MPKHHVSKHLPSLFHPEIAARNGRIPTAGGFRRFADAYNSIVCRQKKQVLLKWQDLRHLVDSPGLPTPIWPFYFRTGENVASVDAHVGVSRTGSTAGVPSAVLQIFRASDDNLMNTNGDGSIVFAGDTTDTDIGGDLVSHQSVRVRGLAEDTEYYGYFLALNGLRILYANVFETPEREANDQVLAVANPSRYGRGAPIKRLAVEELATSAREIWRHNATPLFHWTTDYQEDDATDPGTTSGSFGDVIANSAAARLDTTMRGTLQRTNAIPVKMAVRATAPGGGGGDTAEFRLTDGTNNITITGAVVDSDRAWYTTTSTISSTPATWRMQFRRTAGTQTVRVSAWTLFQWEA